jgi:hypothetical protein
MCAFLSTSKTLNELLSTFAYVTRKTYEVSRYIVCMNQRSVLRDTAFMGCIFIAFLAILGVLIAMVLSEPPVTFLIDLFTDPFWLFVVAIGLFFVVTAYRRAKANYA